MAEPAVGPEGGGASVATLGLRARVAFAFRDAFVPLAVLGGEDDGEHGESVAGGAEPGEPLSEEGLDQGCKKRGTTASHLSHMSGV